MAYRLPSMRKSMTVVSKGIGSGARHAGCNTRILVSGRAMSRISRRANTSPVPEQSLAAEIGGSRVSMVRIRPRDLGPASIVTIPRDDGFGLIYQLRDAPAHDLWIEGKHRPVPVSPKSTMRIIDLREATQARLGICYDSLNMQIPRAALDAFAETSDLGLIGDLNVPAGHTGQDPVLQGFEGSVVAMLREPQAHRLVREHLMLAMLAHVAVTYGRPSARTAPRGGLAPWQIRRAKELLAADPGNTLSLASLAGACELSPSHFSRAFKVSTGLSPYGWLQRHRIESAKELLRRGEDSLVDIAIGCGFADQSHFTRAFSREAGISPGKWQRDHRSS